MKAPIQLKKMKAISIVLPIIVSTAIICAFYYYPFKGLSIDFIGKFLYDNNNGTYSLTLTVISARDNICWKDISITVVNGTLVYYPDTGFVAIGQQIKIGNILLSAEVTVKLTYRPDNNVIYKKTFEAPSFYILEAESLVIQSPNTVLINPEYHSGKAVLLLRPIALKLKVAKVGYYDLKLVGSGNFSLVVDNIEFYSPMKRTGSYVLFKIYLTSGAHTILIIPRIKNLIPNPSFEGTLNYWNFTYALDHGYLCTINDTTAYNGKCSLEVTTSRNTRLSWSWIATPLINVTSGEKYYFVIAIKQKNIAGTHVPIIAVYPNGYEKEIKQIPCGIVGTGTFGWRVFSGEFIVPKGAIWLKVCLNVGWVYNKNLGNGSVWFDDVMLLKSNTIPILDYMVFYLDQ